MFFMIGISQGMKEFEYHQTAICRGCGRYGSYSVFMTYSVLSLFFIPCFKWNKQYFVRMSCCGKIYQLDPEIGKRIAKGEEVFINPEDLGEAYTDYYGDYGNGGAGETARWANWTNDMSDYRNSGTRTTKTCAACGYSTDEDFEFCPKCGRRFD